MLDKIHVGNKPVQASELVKWCMENGFGLRFTPNKEDKSKPTAYINLLTKAREAKFLPILKSIGWKHYHYPPSNSIYKSVCFTDISI